MGEWWGRGGNFLKKIRSKGLRITGIVLSMAGMSLLARPLLGMLLGERAVISVGTLKPRKCMDRTLEAFMINMLENINKYCWDGEWYVAGINDEGIPYGTKNDKEAKRFLNTQTWAVISGAATGERLKKVSETIESMGNEFGYVLIDPPFSEYNPVWGRVSIKMRGTTENGSVYCHSVMFKAFADCICGNGDAARDTIMRILPTNAKHSPEKSLQIPIYYSNYYVGYPDENFGRSSCHYRTGTVAWHFWVILEYIFGLQMSATNGVKVNPCLPKEWNNVKLTRRFGEKKFELTINDGKCKLSEL